MLPWIPLRGSGSTSASSKGRHSKGTRQFIQRLVDGFGIQMLAVTPTNTVVGWCDIIRNPHEGFRHVGRLGMGLLPEYRGRGLGRQLAVHAIRAARQMGIERIELEVFASNTAAIALYRALGFVTEGTNGVPESWTARTTTTSSWLC